MTYWSVARWDLVLSPEKRDSGSGFFFGHIMPDLVHISVPVLVRIPEIPALVPADTAEPRRARSVFDRLMSSILLMSHRAQVGTAVVQNVTVDVIPTSRVAGLKPQQETLQGYDNDLPASSALRRDVAVGLHPPAPALDRRIVNQVVRGDVLGAIRPSHDEQPNTVGRSPIAVGPADLHGLRVPRPKPPSVMHVAPPSVAASGSNAILDRARSIHASDSTLVGPRPRTFAASRGHLRAVILPLSLVKNGPKEIAA